MLSPDSITPLHGVRNQRLVDDLASDMEENGWQGRPLLVVERDSGHLAWTGSHRIAAAQKAGLPTIPCYTIPESMLTRRGFDAEYGHVQDYERLNIIRKCGDETAIHLMWQEGRV